MYGSLVKCSISSEKPENCDKTPCSVNGDLLTEVLSLCGCLTSSKAGGSSIL